MSDGSRLRTAFCMGTCGVKMVRAVPLMRYRRPTFVAVAVTLLPAMACSNTKAVTRPVTPAAAQAVLRGVSDRRMEVALQPSGSTATTPEPRAGYLLGANAGSFIFREDSRLSSPNLTEIPFDRTRAITYKNRSLGALEGALIGVLPGLVGGLLLGSAAESMQCSSDESQRGECKSYALKYGLGLGAFTATIGALIGLGIGHRTTLTF